MTAERCIFSTVNFCLIDLNVRASSSELMTSLHNSTEQSRAFVRAWFAMLVKLSVLGAVGGSISNRLQSISKSILETSEVHL